MFEFKNLANLYDADKKIWLGPKKKSIFGSDMTIGEVALFMLNSAAPEKVIRICDTTGEELTAGQLRYECQIIAKNLIKFGINIGDVIGFSVNHSKHMISVLIATFLCGAPENSVHVDFDKETIKTIFGTTTPKVVFCDIESYKNVKTACDELNLNVEYFLMNAEIDGVRNVKELLIDDGTDFRFYQFPCKKLSGDDVAVLLCTSGTTGTPSVIQTSHCSLLQQTPSVNATFFLLSSIYWISCLNAIITCIISLSKIVVTQQPFTPLHFLQILKKHKVTHVGSTPNQLARILECKDLDIGKFLIHTQLWFCYGSLTPQVISNGMNKIFKERNLSDLVIAYGMSEVPTGVAVNIFSSKTITEGNVGQLLHNADVRIIDEDGQHCGMNERGRIHVRPKFKLLGYYRNPEANKKAFVDDNWFITSDIGYFNEDGDLHICTRNNDIFKSNNFPIFPEQIEEVILTMPGVSEVCVFGKPDSVATNLISCAVVRTKSEEGEKLTESDIIEMVAKHKAPCYHIKGGVHFVEYLPKTPTDKIKRRCILDIVNLSENNQKL